MVVAVGCYLNSGKLHLFNSTTKENKFLQLRSRKVKKIFHLINLSILVDDNDIHQIESFMKEMKTKINEKIDYFCVEMSLNCRNDFRKKFINIARDHNKIKNVNIISDTKWIFCGAIDNLSFIPETGDSILIFCIMDAYAYSNSWNYNSEKQWKFKEFREVNKTSKVLEKSPTIEDLQKLKLKMKANLNLPHICVFNASTLNENDFKSAFLEYKDIKFIKEWDPSGWILSYARCLTEEKEYLKFKSEPIFGKFLEIKISNETCFKIYGKHTLPLAKKITTQSSENDVLNVYENENLTEIVPLEKGNLLINLYIDLNSIFFIKIINLDKTDDKKAEFYFIPKKLSDYNPTLNAIGIDFGTTECCAAVIRKNGPDFVVLDQTSNNRTLPSYIAFDEENPKCGQIVVDRMRHKFEYTVYDLKRIIGKELESITTDPLWPFKVIKDADNVLLEVETFNGKDTKTLEQISAILLSHIKTTVETYQNDKLSEVVITTPSKFSFWQKQATKMAAERAGWEKIYFLPEPVAAAFAYFTEMQIKSDSIILIFDCGGGTVDICVAKVKTDKLEILGYDGDSFLGGRDFDKLLFNHFNAVLKHKYDYDVMKTSKKYVLKQKCQVIKHKLSAANEDWLDVDDFDPNINEVIKITKEEFEEMSSNFLVKMEDVIIRSIMRANITRNAINYVFQVGGGCRMPMVKKLLKSIFPNANHQCSLYPDWVVAHGAALYAYHLKTEFQSSDKNYNPQNAETVASIRQMLEKL